MYKKKKIIIWCLAILTICFILKTCIPVAGKGGFVALDSQEMKLLLQNEFFADREKGYQQYWDIIKNLAIEMNVGVQERKHAFAEETKKVVYYDTKNMDLAKNNYILRQRSNIERGKAVTTCELTLKYRKTGGREVLEDAVVTSPAYTPKISFQQDCIGFYNGVVGQKQEEISLSHTLKKVDFFIPQTLGDSVTYFPTLGNLEIPLEEPLYAIHDTTIIEYKVTPGTLDFGGVKGQVSISLWFNYDTGQPITAEVSWECDKNSATAAEKSDMFFRALQERTKDILQPGQAKTSLLTP